MHVGNRYGIHNLGADVRPLALRVSAELASGEQTAANTLSLQNQTGDPWEVHEFKFYMRPQSNTAGRASGGFIQAALAMDNFPITDGFVPTWATAPANALDLERLSPNWVTWATNANLFGAGPLAMREDGMYYWKLDHPLYVPPGSAIKTQFNHTGLDPTAIVVGLTASGRVLPSTARPASIRVPWVSCWQSQMYEVLAAGGDPEQSPETQLNNPFGTELHAERFVGRINQVIQYISNSAQQSIVSDIFSGPFERLFRATHLDSTGNLVVPQAGSFRNVYGSRNRAWHVRHTMPPGAYHRVTLTKSAVTAGTVINPGAATDKVIGARAQVQVSLIGWREEKI